MKDGFGGDEKRLADYRKKNAKIAKEARALFADVDAETRNVLTSGFGSRIAAVFGNPRLRKEDAWFESDGSRSELRPVIDKLIDLH